jgi:uncharacterized protein
MRENLAPRHAGAHREDHQHGPFVLDVRALGRRPGTLRAYRRRVPAPAGLGLDLVAVPEGAPLELDVRLEAVTEGVLVTGTVTAAISGECARCLDPVRDELAVQVCELFAYPDSTTDATAGADEVHRIRGEHLDLEPVVRDAVVLGLPFTPLCRADCAGLCPTCGQRLDELPAGHAHEALDPRWAALAAFTDAAGPSGGAPSDSESQE